MDPRRRGRCGDVGRGVAVIATIPAGVRQALGLHAGEIVAFDVVDGAIRLRKATPMDLKFVDALQDTLSEWATQGDEDAYRGL